MIYIYLFASSYNISVINTGTSNPIQRRFTPLVTKGDLVNEKQITRTLPDLLPIATLFPDTIEHEGR